MKKMMLLVLGIASCCMLLPWQGTESFLTSEKSIASPVSLGTNEDVFRTEAKSVSLITHVKKKVRITKKTKPDGTTEETKDAKTDIHTGSESIVFVHQRSGLYLDDDSVTVTGDAAGDVDVDVTHDDRQSVVTVRHKRGAVKEASGRVEGTLRVRALGGFYDMAIPLSVVTKFELDTEVVETKENPPVPPADPGNPPPQQGGGNPPSDPSSGGSTTQPAVDSPSVPEGGGTPSEPPTSGGGTGSLSDPPTGGGGDADSADSSTSGTGGSSQPDAGNGSVQGTPASGSSFSVPSGGDSSPAEEESRENG